MWPRLGLLVLVALALRLLVVALAPPLRVQSDASGYDAAARRQLATGTYAFPVGRSLWADDLFREDAWASYLGMPSNAWSMPGYSWFLAGVYRLSGTGPERFAAVRATQALLGALTVALIFFVADSLLGRRAAWTAAAFAAVYPPSLRATGYLLTETLFTLLFVGQVAAMVWAARLRRAGAYAVLGTVTAAAAYVRPMAVLVPLPLLALEVHRELREPAAHRAVRGHVRRFAILALVAAALLAPWWIRNHRLYGVFMPATSAMALPAIQGELMVRGLAVPDETYAQFALPALTGNDDHAYAERVADRIREVSPLGRRPDVAAGLLGRARMLGPALLSPFTFFVEPFRWRRWEVGIQAFVLVFAALGLRHRRRGGEAGWLIAGVAGCVVLVHWQVGFLTPRYLYPAMPLLLALAGAGVDATASVGRGLRRGRGPRVGWSAVA